MRPFSKQLRHTLLYRLPVIALCAVIFWQSSAPSVIKDPLFPLDDKVFHFIVYSLLGLLTARCLFFEKPGYPLQKILVATIVLCTLFGLSDEIHQYFVPSRYASAGDLAADAAGSAAGAFIYLYFFLTKIRWRV